MSKCIPFEQPVQINTLDPENATFRWTSSLDYLFQDDTVVFTITKLSFDSWCERSEVRKRFSQLACLWWSYLFFQRLLFESLLSVRWSKTSSNLMTKIGRRELDPSSRDMTSVSVTHERLLLVCAVDWHRSQNPRVYEACSNCVFRFCKVIREVKVSRQILFAFQYIIFLSVNTFDKYSGSKYWKSIWSSVCHKLYCIRRLLVVTQQIINCRIYRCASKNVFHDKVGTDFCLRIQSLLFVSILVHAGSGYSVQLSFRFCYQFVIYVHVRFACFFVS